MKETCAQFWAGKFGDEYTQRNRVAWKARVPFWSKILERTHARNVFELGPNAGWNLRAIRTALQPEMALTTGLEINTHAAQEACDNGDAVYAGPSEHMTALFNPAWFDLTFTAGVLIHMPPEQLQRVMADLVSLSGRWVLAIEYAADEEEGIEYRDHIGRLWRRPFGRLYERLGLKLVESGDAGPAFDKCQYWLMEKR